MIPPTAPHVIAKTGTGEGARVWAAVGAGLGSESEAGRPALKLSLEWFELLLLLLLSPIMTGWAQLWLGTARDVQPFLRGIRALAAPFKILAEPTSAAAATESENVRREEVDPPTIACGGAVGVGVGMGGVVTDRNQGRVP